MFTKRDAHWEAPPTWRPAVDIPMLPLPGVGARGQKLVQKQRPVQQQLAFPPPPPPQPYGGDKGTNRVSKPTPGSIATHLEDGKKLGPDFQKGTCTKKSNCPLGLHRCGMVTRKGCICGLNSHGAYACRQR